MAHTRERLYSCTVCGKRFAYLKTMKRHSNVHTRTKLNETSKSGVARVAEMDEAADILVEPSSPSRIEILRADQFKDQFKVVIQSLD